MTETLLTGTVDTPVLTITPWSLLSVGTELNNTINLAATDAAWPNANTAIVVPIQIPVNGVITKMFWANGATISTPGSVDVAVWTTGGTLLSSTGSQTPSGTTNIQTIDVTDYAIAKGVYYMGMTASVANAANYLSSSRTLTLAAYARIGGAYEITSAAPPFTTSANPATFASLTRAFIPVFGIQLGRAAGP